MEIDSSKKALFKLKINGRTKETKNPLPSANTLVFHEADKGGETGDTHFTGGTLVVLVQPEGLGATPKAAASAVR